MSVTSPVNTAYDDVSPSEGVSLMHEQACARGAYERTASATTSIGNQRIGYLVARLVRPPEGGFDTVERDGYKASPRVPDTLGCS